MEYRIAGVTWRLPGDPPDGDTVHLVLKADRQGRHPEAAFATLSAARAYAERKLAIWRAAHPDSGERPDLGAAYRAAHPMGWIVLDVQTGEFTQPVRGTRVDWSKGEVSSYYQWMPAT